MIVHHPTPKQLQYLVALRQHGHFGKAAESCFVTQSTLSAGLRELETLLGTTLVERTRRVVRFTPLGLRIADKAVRVLRESEELADMARAEALPLTGELRMGVIPTIAPFLLPTMLPRLRDKFPRLRLFLREDTSQAACDALHRGQLDCILLAMPYACGDIEFIELFDDALLVAFPFGEAPPARSVEARSIDETRLLLLEDGHCLKDQALEVCHQTGAHEHPYFRATSLETLRQMIGSGNGATLMPWLAVNAPISQAASIRYLPFRQPAPSRKIALVWRKAAPRAAFLAQWGNDLARHMSKSGPKKA